MVRGSISASKSALGALEKKGRTKETLSRGPFGDASHGTFVVRKVGLWSRHTSDAKKSCFAWSQREFSSLGSRFLLFDHQGYSYYLCSISPSF